MTSDIPATCSPLRPARRPGPHAAHGPRQQAAALIYQHATNKADQAIAQGLNELLKGQHDPDGGAAGRLSPWPNCTLIARRHTKTSQTIKAQVGTQRLTWALIVERVRGIEPPRSAGKRTSTALRGRSPAGGEAGAAWSTPRCPRLMAR
jgi:hypothetical protein